MSFRLKTILGIALIAFVLLSGLLWAGLHFMASSAEAEFRKRTEATVKAFSVATKNALISSDLAEISSMTGEMLGYPGVVYARVLDGSGRVLAVAGRAPAAARAATPAGAALDALPDGVLDVHALVSEAGTTFGTIEIGVSAAELRAQLADARRFGLLLAALETLLVAFSSWLLGAYLTRQLKDLSGAASRLATGELGVQIPVRGRDELAQTAASFNHMSASLAAGYAALSAREQELRLRGQVIDASSVGTLIADASLTGCPLVDANPAFERCTGFSRSDVLGQPWFFLERLGVGAEAMQRVRQAVAAGQAFRELLPSRRADGTTFWNDLQLLPLHDDGQRLAHYVALIEDVSARVQAQQVLGAREAYLRRVLDGTHDGIVVLDAAGRIESFNAGAERLFARRADDVLGHAVQGIVPPAHRDAFAALFTADPGADGARALGVERELELRRDDDKPLWIAVRLAELPLDDAPRHLAVVHDITARKLGEIELRQAKEAAEAATHVKSDFLAHMSHEIRTPMQGVLGSLEMLRDTPLSPPQQRHLDTAASSATLLLGVIDEILDFSRLEAGRLHIESLDFDLRRTVEDVIAMLSSRAQAKGLELACFVAPEVAQQRRGDPIRLRQVLSNLVGNAIKFTDRGEVVLSVRAAEVAGGLHFEVRDTGIGIAQDKQAELFQPFIQGDSSTSRRYGGSGLGLSISRRLVELMGGQIGMNSRPGLGSTFWFTLPPAANAAPEALPGRHQLAGTRALVLDDKATNRRILTDTLRGWGMTADSSASAEEALALLKRGAGTRHPYDVALLDLNLPGIDGYTMVARLQADPQLQVLPVIMLSSTTRDPVRLVGLRVDVWLDKPVRQADLADALATVLRAGHVAAAAATPGRAANQHSFSDTRVLLAEDNPVSGEIGMQMLRNCGADAELATDGEAAFAAYVRHRHDLVLMDVQMPVLDGLEATRRIRAWEAERGLPRVPVIALTAHALPADRERCLAAGMDDHVVKPYSSDELAQALARWLAPPAAGAGRLSGPAGADEAA